MHLCFDCKKYIHKNVKMNKIFKINLGIKIFLWDEYKMLYMAHLSENTGWGERTATVVVGS